MKRSAVVLILLALVAAFLPAVVAADGPTVVASTSWTAALARAAGATDITVIAPFELQHPPEYEIKPSDLEKVRQADLVVFAGYEKFAQKLAETAGGDNVRTLKLTTDNRPENVKAQAALIAAALGTTAAEQQWAAGFDTLAAQTRAQVQQALPQRKAIVQAMQKTYAEWLGFDVVGTFGPAEPSPAVVAELARVGAAIVIDNYHNATGQAIADTARVPYVQLINFPGKDGTVTIEDVYRYNEAALLAAATPMPPARSAPGALVVALAAVAVVVLGGVLWLRRR